jgi:hypothetical protein
MVTAADQILEKKWEYNETVHLLKNGIFWDVTPCGSCKSWFLQEPHGVTSQKTPFFVVTAVKTSNLTRYISYS